MPRLDFLTKPALHCRIALQQGAHTIAHDFADRGMMRGPLERFVGYPHIWLGVSAENEKYGLPRIEALVETLE